MSLLFDRQASMVFGVRKNIGKDVTGLRIKFKVEKTLDPSPNKAQIQVWNLNENSRALAEQKNLVVVLAAGYGLEQSEIFSGDIVRTFSELERADYVTTFENGDGMLAFQKARTDQAFAKGTSLVSVFKQVAGTLTGGDPNKLDLSAVGNGSINSSMALSGLSRTHMDDLCKRLNLTWSIQDGQVQILPKGGNIKRQAVLLTPTSGLIGIPKKKNGGIDGQSLLNAKIVPGGLIDVESKFISGTFCVQKTTLEGDTHGKEWFTSFEALPVNGTKLNNAGGVTKL